MTLVAYYCLWLYECTWNLLIFLTPSKGNSSRALNATRSAYYFIHISTLQHFAFYLYPGSTLVDSTVRKSLVMKHTFPATLLLYLRNRIQTHFLIATYTDNINKYRYRYTYYFISTAGLPRCKFYTHWLGKTSKNQGYTLDARYMQLHDVWRVVSLLFT